MLLASFLIFFGYASEDGESNESGLIILRVRTALLEASKVEPLLKPLALLAWKSCLREKKRVKHPFFRHAGLN